MSNGAKVALGVGAGYLLGRTRKTKLALMLALGGLTGKFSGSPTELLTHSLKSLGASAELTQLTDQLRGELLDAARAAALTAATSQINALNDRLQGVPTEVVDETLDGVTDTLDGVTGNVSGVTDTVGKTTRSVTSLAGLGRSRSRRRNLEPEDADEYEADLYEDDEPLDLDDGADDDEAEADEADDIDEDFEDAEDLDEEDLDEEPAPPVRRRRAAKQPAAAKASVRRSTKAASQGEPNRQAARRRPAPASAAAKRAPVRRGR